MDKEQAEARVEIQKSLDLIADIRRDLSAAKKWSWFDLLGGGSIASIMKRGRISDINQKIDLLSYQLEKTRKEVLDLGRDMNLHIPNSFSNQFFDIAFDNIFTDISTKTQLDETEEKNHRTADGLAGRIASD